MSHCSESYVADFRIAKKIVDTGEIAVLKIRASEQPAWLLLMSNRSAHRRQPRAVAKAAPLDVTVRDAVVVLLGLIILILVIGNSGVMV